MLAKINVLDMAEEDFNDEIKDFSCPPNSEIEEFLKNSAYSSRFNKFLSQRKFPAVFLAQIGEQSAGDANPNDKISVFQA